MFCLELYDFKKCTASTFFTFIFSVEFLTNCTICAQISIYNKLKFQNDNLEQMQTVLRIILSNSNPIRFAISNHNKEFTSPLD